MVENVGWYTKLAPGVYVEHATETLHLQVDELLEANGIADTPANRERIVKAARDCFSQLGIPMEET